MMDIKDMTILETKTISKTFKFDIFKKNQKVLNGVSFRIDDGQFVGLIGPNGAGKTTLLKCLLDFLHPEEGEILFFGNKLNINAKRKIGYLPERPYFHDFLTGNDFLKLHWDLSGADTKKFSTKSEEILNLVRLTDAKNKKLKNYSKGMLQRIGLAQALIADPQLLILDEPMSGLDPDGRILFKEILKSLKQKKMTALMSSHLLEDIEELCDYLVVVHQGKIVYNGLIKEFKSNFLSLEEAYQKFKSTI